MSSPSDDLAKLLGPDRRRPPRPGWQASIVLAVAVFALVGMIAIVPKSAPDIDVSALGFADDMIRSTVISVVEGPCSYDASAQCDQVDFELSNGDGIYSQEFGEDPGQPSFSVGDGVYIATNQFDDGTVVYQYGDRDRRGLIAIVALVFVGAVIALARWRGVYAVLGLTASVLVLLWFVIPSITAGRDPVLVALVGGSAIALIALYLTHGPTPLTHISAIGAFGSLALTVILSWLVLRLALFSGLVSDESFFLVAIPNLDLNGLLLAGIVLGTIGALDDVTVTQASAVWEIRQASPSISTADLYAAGLRVGRDHIASTVNTLLLAYAGAALPLLILFSLSGQGLGFVVSSEVIALEIVSDIGGIGRPGRRGAIDDLPRGPVVPIELGGNSVSGGGTPRRGGLTGRPRTHSSRPGEPSPSLRG